MIDLYCNILRAEEKSIFEEIKALGREVQICLSKDGFHKKSSPNIALLRMMSHTESQLFANYFECSKIRCLNTHRAIRLCTDKAALAILAESHRVPQPRFHIVFAPSELAGMREAFGGTFVVKPISSSWGRGVCRIQNQDCLETWISSRESLDANHRQFPVLAQEYIEKPGYDIRVVVVGMEPIVAFRRISENWKTNTHQGAKVEPIAITPAIEEIIALIASMMGPGIFGVDLFETRDGKLLLNEINHNPEFAGSSQVHGVNVAQAIAKEVSRCVA